MSAKEMKDLDDQVLQVANRAGEARCADEAQQAEQETERLVKAGADKAAENAKRQKERELAQLKMRNLLTMLAKVAACTVGMGVFLALLLDPKLWVPVLGCVGIMTFIVMGAICIDRYCRR